MPNNSLRPIRERKGMTLAQLAGKTSISIRTLQIYEAGERTISADDLRKLSRVLYASPAELLQPSEAPPPPPPPVETEPSASSKTSAVTEATEQPAPPPTPPAPEPIARSNGEGHLGEGYAGERRVTAEPTEFVRRPFPAPPRGPGFPPPHGEFRRPPLGGPTGPRPTRPPRGPREPRTPRPVGPATKGQIEQIHNLARRMGLDETAIEERIGAPLSSLDHLGARNAIAKLRQEMEESGTWQPRVGEGTDQEGAYLQKLRDRGTAIAVQLIDGERVEGVISGYTPYVIHLRGSEGNEVAVRKLAIAYYQTKGPVDDAE